MCDEASHHDAGKRRRIFVIIRQPEREDKGRFDQALTATSMPRDKTLATCVAHHGRTAGLLHGE